ncbi:xanthine dehydrogenase family protein molybdopterin-binding subunit [Ancylobacter defluvii]|uniref:Aldehyde dehydrogenase n=1 Tax=Ancylobacter defluvii TaxID=1282440 RepID=A0A9W6K085_9HYPH|nr:xanthine dehydrogenase family protein molybdopterin-binding subunit [Ancylobacter defluvii]MBS7588948.1 xanthine dehydrogenase family protein molybdopterin-binding subunit [Ancylobacter defluvii]GLK84548.1 aldehyde dehydrogenase [Ancylobacter defluvii]
MLNAFAPARTSSEAPEFAETPAAGLSRRSFLVAGLAAGGGLLLSIGLPKFAGEALAADGPFAPDAFIRIGSDGAVTLVMPQVEMGQGTYTSLPMLIAEELQIDLSQVRLEHAPPDDKLYGNPAIGFQVTGGSTSIRGFYEPLRKAGASARTMLVAAAAQMWGVDPAACDAAHGVVLHPASGRQASYGSLAEKAAAMPVPKDVALKPVDKFTLIGTPAKRLDAAGKVDGTAAYGIDVKLPGLKVATVAACPVFGGKLKSVDDTDARAVKGVRQVVKLDDAVAVVADHMGAAKKGLAALKIEWDEGPNATLSTEEIVRQMEALAATGPGVDDKKVGDVEAAERAAARTVKATYQMPFLAHTTMEPLNCTVHVRPDACEVWVGSQVLSRAQATAAEVTGLPREKVTVHNHLLGGGFGRRLEVDSVTQAVKIAKQVDGPVKVVWTREEDIQHDIYRPYYYDQFAAGLDAQGKVTSFRHRVVGSSIVARWLPQAFTNGLDFDAVDGAAGPYGFANLHVDYVRHMLPQGLETGWWRGVGVTHNAFVVEGFVDELAVEAKADPVAFRRELLANDARARGVLDLAAQKAGWSGALPARSGRGVSLLLGFGTYMAQVAEVEIGKDGAVKVSRIVCAVDCGVVINPDTVKAQVQGGIVYGLSAALYGQITLKDGRVEQSNFDSYQALRIEEMPAIEVHIVESREAPGGIGEPSTSGVAPAVVNAVFAATGQRLRQLPIDPDRLKGA